MKYFFSIPVLLLTGCLYGQDCKATLTIETDNEAAFVIINESAPVQGKNSTHKLSPGTYYLTIGENSDRWDAKTFYDTIIIKDCKNISRSYNFFSQTYLDTDPQDAYVFSEDTLVGHTPLLLPPDIKNITLSKPGYEERIISLNNPEKNLKIKLNAMPLQEDDSFFESPLFLYLSGSLLLFGSVTAYYKLEADDKYAEYQVTGNERLLKDTRRLDTISGIAFTVLQINFGFLIYYFLTD